MRRNLAVRMSNEHGVFERRFVLTGNGIRELRDNNASTFWQSDSLSPHTITLHFSQTLPIARVDLLINLQQDESYTPTVVQIKIGMSCVH